MSTTAEARPSAYTASAIQGYKEGIKHVAGVWGNDLPEYQQVPGSKRIYQELQEIIIGRMSTNPEVAPIANSVANHGGFEVMTNFFYTGAAKAALIGYSLESLGSSLYQPASFRQLTPLMQEVSHSARSIEEDLGLINGSGNQLREFRLDGNGLAMPFYPIHRINGRRSALDHEIIDEESAYSSTPEDDPIRCKGHLAGLTPYAYKYILQICIEDPSLFAATLTTHSEKLTA